MEYISEEMTDDEDKTERRHAFTWLFYKRFSLFPFPFNDNHLINMSRMISYFQQTIISNCD